MAGSGQRNEWITNTKTKRWNIWKKQTQIDLFNVPHDLISKRSGFLVFGEQCSERLHFPSRGWPIGGIPGRIALTLDFQVLNFTLEPSWRSKTPWAKGPAHFDIPPRHVMYFRMGWLKVFFFGCLEAPGHEVGGARYIYRRWGVMGFNLLPSMGSGA